MSRRGGVFGASNAAKLDRADYPPLGAKAGRLRMREVVADAVSARNARTTTVDDALERISDTRVLCMATVTYRGCTRSVALVTTERPVHERAPARAARATARRTGVTTMVDANRFIEECAEWWRLS